MLMLLLMLAAYGLCFGLMNKALVLHRGAYLERMFECAYCTGFHCGWITWLAGWALAGPGWVTADKNPRWEVLLLSVVLWSLGVSTVCYLVDTAARRLEGGPGNGA